MKGQPGGKETAQSVTHYIIPGAADAKLAATALKWVGEPYQPVNWKTAEASKMKFSCGECT